MIGSISFAELGMLFIFAVGALLVVALPAARICARLGFPPWLGLLAAVPMANLGLLWYVALTPWPERGDGIERATEASP